MTAAAFSACYADWKLIKTRACVQIVLEIPIERANEAYAVLGGMPISANEVWCGVARLDTNKVAPKALAAPTDTPKSHRLTTRAVMLAKDGLFRRFLEIEAKLDNVTEEEATAYIRTFCRVASRSEIKPGTEAGNRLDLLESGYIAWRDRDKFIEASK